MIHHPFLDSMREQIRAKNNQLASRRMSWIKANPYYYGQLIRSLKFIVEPGAKVLHIGCSTGYILNELQPAVGIGVDDSGEQIEIARKEYPHLTFINLNAEDPALKPALKEQTFDYIVVTSIEEIVDLLAAFKNLAALCTPHTRLVLINYNYLWNPLVSLAETLRLKVPQKLHNWITLTDLTQMLELSRFSVITWRSILLYPFYIPLLSYFLNRILVHLPLFRRLTFIWLTVARPVAHRSTHPSVSVIIPCKNEAGNIEEAVTRIPALGSHTEILFGDDNSTDGTADKVREMIKRHPDKDIQLYQGPGISKAENVWTGFDRAKGDILMILDADLTVLPEELPYFYEAIVAGRGEFVNGSRLVYPMHAEAMRFFNVIGNKFFSELFSFILGTRIKDTLCGTKVLWRTDYEKIKALRGTWGVEDRWGDYELIFGAAKRHLQIVDLPVHYTERTYGETKMTHRFKNGRIMLQMCWAAMKKYKFQTS